MSLQGDVTLSSGPAFPSRGLVIFDPENVLEYSVTGAHGLAWRLRLNCHSLTQAQDKVGGVGTETCGGYVLSPLHSQGLVRRPVRYQQVQMLKSHM